MPTQVHCPHCLTPCRVSDEFIGRPVQCYRCAKTFTVQPVDTSSSWTEPATGVAVGPPHLDIGVATSCGRVRTRNEDSYLVKHQAWSNLDQRHELALLVVADGMGGHEAGDKASGIAIRSLGKTLEPLLSGGLGGQFKDAETPVLGETIGFAIQEANRAVFRKGQSDPPCKGMGATAAVVLIWDGSVLIGHVGDCRVYHQRAGRLTQVTRDQTLVNRMVELGKLTPEEALAHPQRNEVTQALGQRFDIDPAASRAALSRGDWLVVACDGLHEHLDNAALQTEISKSPLSAPLLARTLVQLADQRGGSDNCTVVAAYCV